LFKRVLVANRGEIAVRILRTCKRLGIATVAVHSDADATLPHVRLADEAVRIGPAPVRDSYLNIDAIVAAVRSTSADAVHPGYGLLSENAAFAARVAETGATFIGPPIAALEAFGDKIRAREVARSVGVEPPPGTATSIDPSDEDALAAAADAIGLPLLVKAAGGGGGIGMQIVRDRAELVKAARTCADRGRAAFGDARIYVERYVESPRHIEVQVFRDLRGTGLALGERECSVQRRHQKIIEETPSPAAFFAGDLGQIRREKLCLDALRVVEKAGYVGAGTVEFVFDADGNGHFLEVNARLQVEHPVTEMVTGLDLVELQLRIAGREGLAELVPKPRVEGHAIEARIYAEDPSKGFLPQPGRLERLRWPKQRDDLRIDSGFEEGSEITSHYDPLIAKVIAHGDSRIDAVARLAGALAATELTLMGPKGPRTTNIAFLRTLLADARFVSGAYDTSLADIVARGA
jgi:acetyl-CoA carboxylase biotin carboxylase subunit/3-methylcrotonyl-CoA carboxylase alpha subunit